MSAATPCASPTTRSPGSPSARTGPPSACRCTCARSPTRGSAGPPTRPTSPPTASGSCATGTSTARPPRLDVTVDASAGLPVVTRDLLRGVEVEYLGPDHYASGADPLPVKGWTLEYENGPFDKSLLTRIGQYGTGGRGTEHAWHEFTWFDDVTDPATGDYRGFGDIEQWGSRTGAPAGSANIAATSALGTSWRAGGDGGSYIGFNPIIPSKIGSFGGSFNIAGGQTNEIGTLVDLDGDGLPDKVWVDASGTVMYRPNLNRPGATARHSDGSWFGAAHTITGIDSLGRSSDLRINVHFEAYPVVAIHVGGGFGFSFGDRYFEDVNGDGRVDFIKPGSTGGHTVFYNVLDDGVPTFIDSSNAAALAGKLEVPLDDFDSDLADAEIPEVTQLLVNTSPRIDTVRRWLAPHDGTIRVQGSPGLTAGTAYRGDGAQVTVEHAGAKRWERTLTKASPSAAHDVTFDVTAGESVWFRLHVIDNAADDHVAWSPTVTYLDGGTPLAAAVDANGRSQVTFDAAQDFTLFGRSGARTVLTEAGDMTVGVSVTTLTGLSDDLEVVVLHGRGTDPRDPIPVLTVPQLTTGTTEGDVELTIAAPTTDDGPDGLPGTDDDVDESDWLEVHVVSDSPVDPTQFSVEITTTAPGPEAPDLTLIPADAEVDIPLDIPVVPNVRVFSRTDHTAPYQPITAPKDSRATLGVTVSGIQSGTRTAGVKSPAVVTVKTLDGGVVARQELEIEHSAVVFFTQLSGSATLEYDAEEGTAYYLEVSVADPAVGAAVGLDTSTVTFRWTEKDDDDNDVEQSSTHPHAGQLHWPDVDGLFPSANRGWAFAGYNADHADASGGGPLVEGQFAFTVATADEYDEDTPVPTASDAPSAAGVKGDVSTSFDSAFAYIPWAGPDSDMADRWRAGEKETLHGTGATMQADRLGVDKAIPGLPTTGRKAPQMLSLDGDFNFLLGLVATFSVAAGGGRALKDFTDYNGDGFPDVRSGDQIEFTGPRGAKAATETAGDNTFDTALSLGGGISGSAVAVSSKSAASKNSDGGGKGSNVEPTSTKTSRGMNLGLGFSISSQWTNPLADGEAYSAVSGGGSDAPDVQGDLAADRGTTPKGTPIDRALIDVNGDGLPDRVDTYTSGELWVSLNLGYRFADDAIQWSTGRTSANKDMGGSLSAGFQLNAYEFAGGVAYSESVGYSLFDWMDIDGDGVPDRINNVRDGDGQPETVFGSADGMQREEIVYGEHFKGNVAVDADRWQAERDEDGNLRGVNLPGGQTEVSRSTGLSGGVDFSFYIGPVCAVACYFVINPGFHGGYDRMTSQVQMIDVNGDGWLDAVRSTDSEHLEVRLNQRGRTNMIEAVTNPLGGQLRLDYERTGNTIENPESVWVMSSVEVDDGRGGDGPDVQRSEYTYDGNVYDPLLRELLGFSSVREDQVDEAGTVLRSYERDYLNDHPFSSGLLTEERTLDATGKVVQAATFTWELVNADPHGTDDDVNGAHGDAVATLPGLGTSERTLLFDTALSPRLVRDRLSQWDADDDRQDTETRYGYNVIGDVVTVHERNELEIDGDDTFTAITYSECATRSGDRALGAGQTWVSVPATVTVYGSDGPSGEILRHRNGGPDLCANAAPVRIAELVAHAAQNDCGKDLYAITELSFDTHGSYDGVASPANQVPECDEYPPATVPSADVTFDGCDSLAPEDDEVRYCVDYVYDPHRFTDIAEVTDNHGVSASATYHPFTGRLASRTDENGNLTTYGYDAQGRLQSVTAPREQGGAATVSYAYGGLDATLDHAGPHAWATAHHHDVFNPGNTIDTATFVDGMGRVVQRKRDAQVEGVDGEARIVEGAVEYDALGREAKEWYPTVEAVQDRALTAYNTATSSDGPDTTGVPETDPTVRTHDIYDRLVTQTLPDGSVETVTYDFDVLPGSAAIYGSAITMSRVVTTDPLGKVSTRWLDVGGAVFRRVDGSVAANDPDAAGGPLATLPDGDPIAGPRIVDSAGTTEDLVTTYDYDRLGRLLSVVDTVGARTEHAYDLQDNVVWTTTPDAGQVQRTFAPSGQLLTVERSVGTVAAHVYDRDRLVGIDYSDDTPPVTYEYGDDGAPGNAAGRVTLVSDGSMDRAYGYDEDGNVARELATRHPDPFGKGAEADPPSWETVWEYDSLGRLAVLTYPDGEALAHHYDLGGRPSRLVSQAPQHDLYDQYGDAVSRPDVEIVYVDEVRYDEFGEATYLRTGTGVETRYDHEPTRRFLAGITTDSTETEQYDGSVSVARPLQRLEYTYDAVGNVRDVVNRLYAGSAASSVTDLGPPPENNVPGPSHHALTYDGHYRLTGGAGTYVDQRELREFTYETDYGPNGNLLAKRQVTTTTGTTGGGKGKGGGGNARAKKGDGSGTDEGTTPEYTCESNTGSGGGSFNQDPETTYVIAAGDLEYATTEGSPNHRLVRAGGRQYTHDENGNVTGWVHPCADGRADISRTYEWDAENRLVRMAEGNNDTVLRYNAEGDLALERGPGGTTWFVNRHWRSVNEGQQYANVYLGEQLVASHRTSPQPQPPPPCTDTEEEPCGCDASTACAVPDASECDPATRLYDPTSGTCQPKESRKVYFLHKDLQGSLRVATNEVGGVFQYLDYLPTGEPWVAGQSTIKDTPYLFAGGWTDRTYKLVNFGQRWYDARPQGFLSPEPLLEESPYAVVDDPTLLSAYTYAASNPQRFVDTDGRSPTAANGFKLGKNHKKHESGDISISVARREKRDAPAITFGGRYGNDAKGQALSKAFKKHADRAERFSTILSITKEDGVKKIRVFGVTAKKEKVDAAPAKAGAPKAAATADAAPDPKGAPPSPGATTAADQTAPTNAGTPGAGTAAGGATAPPPAAGGTGDGKAPAPPPAASSSPPSKAAPAATGPKGVNN
jgi:RHS repeat-associated protein